MESERPIEKLLRRYTEKRRQRAKDIGELHPATRRSLLGEVARQHRRTAALRTAPKQWPLWPRLAWTAAIFVVIGVTVSLWIASGPKRRTDGPLLAKNEEAISGRNERAFDKVKAPQTPEMPQLSRETTAPTREDSSRSPLKTFEEKDSIQKRDVPAPASGLSAVQAQATSDAAILDPASRSLAIQPEKPLEEPAKQAANDSIVKLQTATDDAGLNQNVEQERLRLAAPSQQLALSRYRNVFTNTVASNQFLAVADNATFGKKSAETVLVSFAIEQNGPSIWIVDNDGSVYTGSVQPIAISAGTGNRPEAATALEKNVKRSAELAAAAPAAQNDQREGMHSSYFFRAVGTNKSLNQQVIFTGNFLEKQNPTTNSLSTHAVTQPLAQQLLLNNFRISGQAHVGSNQLQIDAVPAR